MNKNQLVDFVSEKMGGSKAEAENYIKAVLEGVEKGLVEDGSVILVGFGTYRVSRRKARVARNPRTGEPINVPASQNVVFRPSKSLKEKVN